MITVAESLYLAIRFLLYLGVTGAGVAILLKSDRLDVRILTLAGAAALIIWNSEIAEYLTVCVIAILSLLLKVVIVLVLLVLLVRLVFGGFHR